MAAPLCRYCGKPIPKATETLWFGQGETACRNEPSRNFAARPANKAEAQRFANGEVVSVRYWGTDGSRYVAQASVWDGESYRSPFFCNNEHAALFGYSAARMANEDGTPNLAMPAYWAAIKERQNG